MTTAQLEKRIAKLEAQVAVLTSKSKSTNPWWEKIAGSFANDPMFEDAMRLGRAWRESQRPKTAKAYDGSFSRSNRRAL